MVLALLAVLGHAQQPAGAPPLEFEVASVKSSQPFTGGTITARFGGDAAIQSFTYISLRSLVTHAYAIKDYQLIGPDWMQETRFDISARMPAGARTRDVPAMLQKLLASRFHLAVHRETRDLPVYALTVAKGGIKTHAPDASDAPKMMPDGTTSMRGSGAGAGMVDLPGYPMSADDLAALLSHAADRPVLDETGLSGKHEFKMVWHVSDEFGLSDALREFLGLRLEPRKAPLEVLVVDHVDKVPVEN